MEKRYKIYEVAKLLEIAPSAIRFYEKKRPFQAKKENTTPFHLFNGNFLIIPSLLFIQFVFLQLYSPMNPGNRLIYNIAVIPAIFAVSDKSEVTKNLLALVLVKEVIL